MNHSKWCEPVSKKPSRTRPGEAQTAEALFRVFGANIPYNGNIDEDYEFDTRQNTVEEMFENSVTNEVTDHREILDIMEEEFLKHSYEPAQVQKESGSYSSSEPDVSSVDKKVDLPSEPHVQNSEHDTNGKS